MTQGKHAAEQYEARGLRNRRHITGILAAIGLTSIAYPTAADALNTVAPAYTVQGKPAGTLFIQGDSITAKYTEQDSYYGIVAAAAGLKPIVVAQGGAGFAKPGDKHPDRKDKVMCAEKTFLEMLTPKVRRQLRGADRVLIEGGRNDGRDCDEKGAFMPMPTDKLSQAVTSYFDTIAELRADEDPQSVYVVTPWATPTDSYNRRRVVPLIRRSVLEHGFQWIDTRNILNHGNTTDGVHPTRQAETGHQSGVYSLAQAILQRSDIERPVAFNN